MWHQQRLDEVQRRLAARDLASVHVPVAPECRLRVVGAGGPIAQRQQPDVLPCVVSVNELGVI